jgi:serine phosphatase RsbU (regulator of sigma subunit)
MAGPRSSARESLALSAAFREAALRSEVRRAYLVLAIMALLFGLIFLGPSTHALRRQIVVVGINGVAIVVAIQLITLLFARSRGRIPEWFIIFGVVAESLIPTGMMFWNVLSGTFTPFVALSSPPLLAYGIMIGLTTLRLRPWLCLLAGCVGGAGYIALIVYSRFGFGVVRPATELPITAYVVMGTMIVISGLAAAWVAKEIRGHLAAALSEADSRVRIEQDLGVARTIQRALLPRAAPMIPGFDIAGWNRPADQTGGDYYDWQTMPDGNWIITLADVAGHGIGPAMVTAACRAYVRASSAQHKDLSSLTSQVNRLLSDDMHEGRFVTMAGVLIDSKKGSISLVSAGHGPIVLYIRASENVQDIQPKDLPLAVMADTQFGPDQKISMGPGDVLALVTDGFVEWARYDSGKREQFGIDRLRESLRRHAGLSAAEMIEEITKDVAAFAGGERQQDDLTMVVIRRG